MRVVAAWILVFLPGFLVTPANATEEGPQALPEEIRPKLALVLSGGGARGAAHIGVLKVLEENRIVPDMIVGTSMGSIVGGLYAAGYAPEEIEDILAEVDWDELFFDTVERSDRSFRRKQDDTPFLIPLKLRFDGWKPYLPGGLLGGQKLELFLRKIVLRATHSNDFDELPIPFRAVAMDLGTSEAVVLGEGNLADAMRASMSIPGAFPPVLIDGKYLVDGGSAANLPVGIAQRLGADQIIAVNISTPLNTEVRRLSFLGVMNQLTAFLTAGSVQNDIEKLRPGDILIQPDLGDITYKSFDRAREAVAIGEAAARDQAEELRSIRSSSERWDRFQDRHERTDTTRLPVEEVALENTSWVDDRLIQSRLKLPVAEPLDEDRLEEDLVRLSGLDYFGLIAYDELVEDDRARLQIRVPEKPYGRGSLQFGVNFRSDFRGNSTYGLLVRHRVVAVNRRGGEWVNTLQVGETSLAATEFYQPLDWGMRWFAAPSVVAARTNQTLWSDGTPIAEARVELYEGSLDVGRVLGAWGEVRLGLYRGKDRASIRIGPPLGTSLSEQLGGARFGFRVDTRDRAVFPSRGAAIAAVVDRSEEALGADFTWTKADLDLRVYGSKGKSTFSPFVHVSANLSRDSTLRSAATLGGFGRLSGLGDNELIDDRGGVIGMSYYYQITGFSLGPVGNRLFAGLHLEAGNVYTRGAPITWNSLRYGGAVFAGAETPLGPAYLGWGWTNPDREQFYLVIGDRF